MAHWMNSPKGGWTPLWAVWPGWAKRWCWARKLSCVWEHGCCCPPVSPAGQKSLLLPTLDLESSVNPRIERGCSCKNKQKGERLECPRQRSCHMWTCVTKDPHAVQEEKEIPSRGVAAGGADGRAGRGFGSLRIRSSIFRWGICFLVYLLWLQPGEVGN